MGSVLTSSKKKAEAKLESQTEKFVLRQHAFILEHLLEVAELHWKETKNELEGVLPAEKMKRDERSPEFKAFKIELMRDKAKVECLLEQMKSVQDERKLKSRRWKKRLSENMEKAEFVLQEMKSMLEEGLGASGLEIQLKEQIAKSELLLEEMELVGAVEEGAFEERFIDVVVKSPVLKMQLKKHIVKVESLLQNMKFVHEESKEDTVELKFLLKELKLAQESGKVKYSLLRSALQAYAVKLKLLLDGTELEKEIGLGSQMLELQLLEGLINEGFVLMNYTRRLLMMEWERPWTELQKISSILRKMESEHKEEGLKPQVLEVKLEQKEKDEHATTSKSLQEKMELVQQESNVKSHMLGMQLKECIVNLEVLLKEEKLEIFKEKLKFRKLKITLYSHIAELEPVLEKIEFEQEEEGLRSQALKMELNEDIVKLELLLEENELEERYVAELKRFIAKAKNINLVREKSTMKSLMLQLEESTVKLKSLLEDIKSLRCSENPWYEGETTHIKKLVLEFLLEGMELKQKEEGLQSQELEIQLEEHIVKLELLVREIESARDVKMLELKEHLWKLKSLLEATKLERDEAKLEIPALEVQLKEQIMQMKKPGKIELFKKALPLEKQLEERIVELKSLQEKINFVQLIGKLNCRPLEMELNRHIMKLESLLMERGPWCETVREHIQKSESLLKETESLRYVSMPLAWKMVLEVNLAKGNLVLAEHIKLEQERTLKSPTLEIEFKQHIAKLESLVVEIKLEQEEVGSQVLEMELGEHIVNSELLLEERELICDAAILKTPVSIIQLEEHLGKVKSRLATMKLGPEKRKLEFPGLEKKLKEHIVNIDAVLKEMKSQRKNLAVDVDVDVDMKLEEHIVNLKDLLGEMKLEPKEEKIEPSSKKIGMERKEGNHESSTKVRKLTPREQEANSPLIAQRPIIVIGGRDQYGQSLRSVEGYIFLQGRWIELPAMNTPRSFMSSVVVGNEIVVSGGDTGDAITDAIEVLNLAETPLQWRISPARLPVPLFAHQSVVYRGKLIVIGGHDGNSRRNSNRIYEIFLQPPHESRILSILLTPVAWHGTELVGDKIFIFGGEGNHSDVLAFDLSTSTLSTWQPLPRAMKGMATVMIGESIAVIGGLDDYEWELAEVFMYNTRSGEHHSLPEMNERRGGCAAVATFTLETRSSCSFEKFTNALFAVGSVRSVNTFEGYSFESHRWTDMPPMRERRSFCSMVVAPVEFDTFREHISNN